MKTVDFSETIAASEMKVGRSRHLIGPRSDKRDLMALKVKSGIFTEKERPSYHKQLLKI